ncbi:hypothetical protein Esti_001935 [Eimeria stiedai]
MHGRRRADVPVLSKEQLEAQRQKVKLGFQLLNQLLDKRASGVHTPEILLATRRLIEFNPDLSTIWNYRREVLTVLLKERQTLETATPKCSSPPPEEKKESEFAGLRSACDFCRHDDGSSSELLRDELQLTAAGLAKGGGKAYCLWAHRAWVLGRLAALEFQRHSVHLPRASSPPVILQKNTDLRAQQEQQPPAACACMQAAPCCLGEGGKPCGIDGALSVLQQELDACEQILREVDGRNFHCWQHRSMVMVWRAALLKHKKSLSAPKIENAQDSESLFLSPACAESSVSLSHSLIESDFSNYSAWHLRSVLPEVQKRVVDEFAWLWQGLYTEPGDQSLWQHYFCLLEGSGAARAGRLLAVREGAPTQDSVVVDKFSLFFFFAEPCALDTDKCHVHGLKGESQEEVLGLWTPLSSLHAKRVSGISDKLPSSFDFSPILLFLTFLMRLHSAAFFVERLRSLPCDLCKISCTNGRPVSCVWRFGARSSVACEELSVHLAMRLYGGSLLNEGRGVDSFHLQRLACAAPELLGLCSRRSCSQKRASVHLQSEGSQPFKKEGKSAKEEEAASALLWKCHTLRLLPPFRPEEEKTTEKTNFLTTQQTVKNEARGRMRQWAVAAGATVAGSSTCACSTNKEGVFLSETQEDVALAEAVAAAGGQLSAHLTREFAENELKNVEELLELEPECKGALEAKLRLLRVLSPHAFEDQLTCLSKLTFVDQLHKRMHEEEQHAVQVRCEVWKEGKRGKCVLSLYLPENIQRLTYPLLLEVGEAEEVHLNDTQVTDQSMVDWHVPYLPQLRVLNIRNTKISRLSLLLLSVIQLPFLERIDSADTQLTLDEGTRFFEEEEELIFALRTCPLNSFICRSCMHFATNGSRRDENTSSIVVAARLFLQFEESDNKNAHSATSVLRRREALHLHQHPDEALASFSTCIFTIATRKSIYNDSQ